MSQQKVPRHRKTETPPQIVLDARADALRRIEDYERAMTEVMNSPFVQFAAEQARKQREIVQDIHRHLNISGMLDAVARLSQEIVHWHSFVRPKPMDSETVRAIALAPHRTTGIQLQTLKEQRFLKLDIAALRDEVKKLAGKKQKRPKMPPLILDENGNLARWVKNKQFTYQPSNRRKKILYILSKKIGRYETTRSLSLLCKTKEKNIHEAMRDLRAQITKKLGVQGKVYLEGKKNLGYRLVHVQNLREKFKDS